MKTFRSDLPHEPAALFNDVMIDIETMSLHKHEALILSIGMVEFDPSPLDAPHFGARRLIIPDVVSQLVIGRRVDVGTQKFWGDQKIDASRHWLEAGERCELHQVCDFVRQFCDGKNKVWAKGPQFDLCNLEGLAEDLGERALWHYQAPRDVRTFCFETQATRIVPIGDALDIPGVPHEPVYDCISQAWQVWSHYAF
jgi:hypothetical protein